MCHIFSFFHSVYCCNYLYNVTCGKLYRIVNKICKPKKVNTRCLVLIIHSIAWHKDDPNIRIAIRKLFCIWATSSEFGTYRLCEQRRFRRACASAQSRQNLRGSLIQAVSQEEPSDRKPDPWDTNSLDGAHFMSVLLLLCLVSIHSCLVL